MKKLKHTYLRFLILLIISCSYCSSSYASHIVGMDLKYTYVSGDTYTIICVVYGDCGSASRSSFDLLYSAQPQVFVYDGDTKIDCINLSPAPPDSGINIAKYVMCASDTNNTTCTNTSNPYPGVTKFVYTGNYTVPHTSHYWRFIFDGSLGTSGGGAGRAAAITNIITSPTSVVQLEDTLDNTVGVNSSPNLSLEPILFFCENNPDSYSPIAIDPDGDSLVFSLISGAKGLANNCSSSTASVSYASVTYLAGYSGSSPLSVNTSTFSFNSSTGEIDFNPDISQRSMVVYNIDEYRSGTFIGSSQREMNFIVVTCSNTPPTATISGATNGTISPDSLHFNVCQNTGSCSFTVNCHEPDSSNVIYVSVIGLPTGATMTLTGDSTNSPQATFSWNTTGIAAGSYPIYLKLKDNYCPVSGVNLIALTINVIADPILTGTDSVCQGGTTLISSSVPGGTWSSNNSSIASIGISTGWVTGVSVGTTEIYYTDSSGACKDSTLFHVNLAASTIAGTNQLCVGATATLSETASGGTWHCSNSSLNITSSGIITGSSIGVDTITYVLPGGCNSMTIITVNAQPVISGRDSVCRGDTINFNVSITGGLWSSNDPAIATINSSTGVLTGTAMGNTSIVYLNSATGCNASFNVYVKRSPQNISGSPQLCYGFTETLTDTTSGGTWNYSGTSLTATGSGIITGSSVGIDTVYYSLPNGCVVKQTITVNPIPSFSGSDSGCTLNTNTLTVSPGGGTWVSSNTSLATVSALSSITGGIVGITPGIDTITYISLAGCKKSIPYTINRAVLTSIVISDTPNTTQCFGTPINFTASTVNAGVSHTLQWEVNGTNIATGDTFTYTPNNGDIVKCLLNSDTLCATPNPNPSNAITMSVIKHTPTFVIHSLHGDTSCIGVPNTYSIASAVDTGTAPLIVWSVNHSPVATGTTSYTFTPHSGDIVSCSMTVYLPCAKPNPDIVSDSIVVDSFQTPTLQLIPMEVCQGNVVTISTVTGWSGWGPAYTWYINGNPVGGGSEYSYFPTNGDSVSCIMVSNYPCTLPTDSATYKIWIVVDPIIIVTITARPGQLIAIGESDTLTANVVNSGYDPAYQWFINGVPVTGANNRTFICNGYHNKDSVSCMVTTGSNTACEGVRGFNWMILEVAPLSIETIAPFSMNDIQLIPNPNNGTFRVEGTVENDKDVTIEICDIIGRIIYRKAATIKEKQLKESVYLDNNFSSGTFFLNLVTSTGRIVKRFVVNR